MVGLKSFLTLGILAAVAYVVISGRKQIGETGLYLGQGLSSLGSSLGTAGSGLGSGIANLISLPAKGFADAIKSITDVVRTVPPVKPLSQGGIPFTPDLPFGGIEIGPESPQLSDDSIPTPANRENSDVCRGITNCIVDPSSPGGYLRDLRQSPTIYRSPYKFDVQQKLGAGTGFTISGYNPKPFNPNISSPAVNILATKQVGIGAGRNIRLSEESYQKLRERGKI